jgi:hypothetical protein
VLAPRPDRADLVASVIDAMRWYGTAAPAVMHATLRLVEEVGRAAGPSPLRARLRRELGPCGPRSPPRGTAPTMSPASRRADRVERAIMLG